MDTKLIIAIAVLAVGAAVFCVLRQKKRQHQPPELPLNSFGPERTVVENVPAWQPEPAQPYMGTVPLMPDYAPQPQAPASTGYTLTAISGVLKGQSFPLQGECLLGRSPECPIRFPADTAGVSGRHCAVSIAPDGTVTLTDVGSTYGTYLSNGQRLAPSKPYPLAPGSTFLLAGLDGPAFLLEQQ